MTSLTLALTVVLASQSPRRVELLKQIGINCHIFPADIDESHDGIESPENYVMRLAVQKAQAAKLKLPGDFQSLPLIAADTTVAFAGKILGKPEDAQDAKNMLQMLSNTTHQVFTAVALAYQNEVHVLLSTSSVEMAEISNAQIDAYLASGEHQGKAGSYGIQGIAAAWIKQIDGSYSGVMGLPIFETASLLRLHGLISY